jgi:hypothetical protein
VSTLAAWQYWAAGWALAAAGVSLAAWALLKDRARGRRRCPRCWYAMDGVPGLRCPECGHAAGAERRLLGTRRRWRLATLSLPLLLAGYAAAVAPRIHARGWPGAIPTWVLARWWPMEGSDWLAPVRWTPVGLQVLDPALQEFAQRCADDEVSAASVRAWVRRMNRQDWTHNTGASLAAYDVTDLARLACSAPPGSSEEQAMTELVTACTDAVANGRWVDHGGAEARVSATRRQIIVWAADDVQRGVEELLGALRSAKPGAPGAVNSRSWERTRATLDRLRTSTVPDLTPAMNLSAVVAAAGRAAGVEAGVSNEGLIWGQVDREAPLGVDPEPCRAWEALDRAMAAIHNQALRSQCGWTVADGWVLVGDHLEVDHVLEVRVYDASAIVDRAPAASRAGVVDRLIDAITQSIDQEGWANNGGDTEWLWRLGSRLIVRAPPKTHVAIDQLMNDPGRIGAIAETSPPD